MNRAHQFLQLWQSSNHILAVAWPVNTGVADEIHLAQVDIPSQAGQGGEPREAHKIDGEIQLLEGFAALKILNCGDIVDCHVEVF